MQSSGGLRREDNQSCLHYLCGPSFETRAKRAPQDDVATRGAKPDPHGEEARKRRLEP